MAYHWQVLLAGMLWLFIVVMKACVERCLSDLGNGRMVATDFFFHRLPLATLSSIFRRQCNIHGKTRGKTEANTLLLPQKPP